jgi:hypothetical protein
MPMVSPGSRKEGRLTFFFFILVSYRDAEKLKPMIELIPEQAFTKA